MVNLDWEKVEQEAYLHLPVFGTQSKTNRRQDAKEKKNISKTLAFVKSVSEKNPGLTKEEFKREVNRAMYGSVSILWLYFFSVAVRILIDYLIDRLYPDDDQPT